LTLDWNGESPTGIGIKTVLYGSDLPTSNEWEETRIRVPTSLTTLVWNMHYRRGLRLRHWFKPLRELWSGTKLKRIGN
jgi:hypothetical protein